MKRKIKPPLDKEIKEEMELEMIHVGSLYYLSCISMLLQ